MLATKHLLVQSPIDSFRSSFLTSLQLHGVGDEEINERYNRMLPKGGERSIVGAIHTSMRGKYIPFSGFILARYNANECNIKGTSRTYLTHHGLRDESLSSFIKACYNIINSYNQLPQGETGFFDLVEWGKERNSEARP